MQLNRKDAKKKCVYLKIGTWHSQLMWKINKVLLAGWLAVCSTFAKCEKWKLIGKFCLIEISLFFFHSLALEVMRKFTLQTIKRKKKMRWGEYSQLTKTKWAIFKEFRCKYEKKTTRTKYKKWRNSLRILKIVSCYNFVLYIFNVAK